LLTINISYMQSLKRIITAVLICSLVLFTCLAVLSIWDVLADDIAWKSLSTLGVLTFSSIIALLVVRTLEHKDQPPPAPKV